VARHKQSNSIRNAARCCFTVGAVNSPDSSFTKAATWKDEISRDEAERIGNAPCGTRYFAGRAGRNSFSSFSSGWSSLCGLVSTPANRSPTFSNRARALPMWN
jgi:hypothetical protein